MDDRSAHPPFVLRVDAGPQVGYGHVGRCLALWEELGPGCEMAVGDERAAEFARRWGVTLAAPEAKGDVTVLDRFRGAAVGEVEDLRTAGSQVCLVDDPGPARALADAVVDPPTGAGWPPAGGTVLGGFDHALLRREIRQARGNALAGVGVLVSLGGSDPLRLTAPLCAALDADGAATTAVLGPGYGGPRPAGRVMADARLWPRTLAGAELLVTGFGHTLLEAAHLGVPAVAVLQKPQDDRDAAAFAAHGTAACAGVDDVVAAVGELRSAPERREAMARRGPALVDGRGAERVARALEALR